MSSDRDALFAAIRDNPEEDTPRLMFADWLDEHGEHERAEFVRLQCELAQLADDASDSQAVYEFLRDRDHVTRPSADWTRIDDGIHRRIALDLRAADLFRRHGRAWGPQLPKKSGVEWSGFHRGFAHHVSLGNLRKLAALAPQLRGAAPAVTLVSTDFTARVVEQLADAGLLGWVRGLVLNSEHASGLRELGRHPDAASVRTLKVRGHGAGIELVSALAETPHWTGLHTLDLSETISAPADAEILFRTRSLHSLRRLHISGAGRWTADTVRALTAGGFAGLTSLRLAECGLVDDAAEVLAAGPHLTSLRTLDLGHNRLTGRGVTALLCSPHLANVAFLGLEGNRCTGLYAGRMATAEPGGLRLLHCHGCRFIASDVHKLARSPRLRTLWYLDLDDNGLGPTAVREIVRGFGKRCPPVVWLTHNQIGDSGAAHIAKSKAAAGLRVLHLKHNAGMTDAGVRALLDSPHLANLDGLGVSTESDELNARLRTRFRHSDLDYP
ncbi:TIGR02996 domain-containing protein [Frigoriglobus tundricola]|uniref:TIGR02996 domain-containing protein n=1 Tax=Frigoriglobus tundricola TaxID=2774151 RepID=A0A6M5YJB7_9BACT|nr:TIGR02996 domain-containing protein [Frigoriglobus tundricola]QJW93430.1 hypothetical protein FTUN_0936 [Frigoriglobus tundricola]